MSQNPEYNAQVRGVGARIADATGRTDYKWEFTVLEDKQVNAFCLPGASASSSRCRRLVATQAAFSRGDPATMQVIAAGLGAGATVGLLLPWSRQQESEADHLA